MRVDFLLSLVVVQVDLSTVKFRFCKRGFLTAPPTRFPNMQKKKKSQVILLKILRLSKLEGRYRMPDWARGLLSCISTEEESLQRKDWPRNADGPAPHLGLNPARFRTVNIFKSPISSPLHGPSWPFLKFSEIKIPASLQTLKSSGPKQKTRKSQRNV